MRNGTSIRSLCAYIGLFSGLFTACGDETVSIDEGDTTCQNACRSGAQRCFDEKQVEICIVKSDGCAAWSEPQLCPGDDVCIKDACQSCPEKTCEAGDRKCDDDGARVCGDFDANGCLEWSEPSPCPDGCDGDVCKGCQNDCNPGQKSCDQNGARVCADVDDDGCLEWSEPSPCPNGCDGDVCKGCQNDCNPGQKSCDPNGARVCADVDDDGCFEWSEPSPCPNGCDGDVCKGCQNDCDPGQKSCDENGARVCADVDEDGCFEWSEPVDCPNGCDGDVCKGCQNACDPGQKSCDENGARACGDFDEDGCFEWSAPSPCQFGCDGNVCKTCQNACTPGQKSCDQNGARVCGDFDEDGCFEWSTPSPCPYGCDGDVCQSAPAYEPTRYPGDAILSPITPYVAAQMRAIRAKNGARNDNSFMKLGDSHMYKDSSFMYCFSTKHPKHNGYDLAGLPVTNAVSAFQSSFDAFARVSVAAVLGKTASFPLANNSKLLKEEIAATNPRFAFYGYGTNDMGWFDYRKYASNGQGGYFAAMQLYFRNVLAAVDSLVDAGIIPIVIGTGWRNDKAKYYGTSTYVADKDLPKHFVTTYNAVSRGIAEYYQIPYYNLQLSHSSIGDFGLSSDGIHHKTIHNGCDFTSQGLAAGANRRNRYAIELLQNAYNAAVHEKIDPAAKTLPFKGDGSHANPYIIDSLPYTHMHTTTSGEKKFDVYNCSASAKEYGPEKIYRLTVSKQTRIRAFAMSASGVDVDVHLLSSLNSNACRVRGDRWLEANLSLGAYYFAVDTFNSTGSNANAGLYLFGVHACDPDDADCGSRDAGQ